MSGAAGPGRGRVPMWIATGLVAVVGVALIARFALADDTVEGAGAPSAESTTSWVTTPTLPGGPTPTVSGLSVDDGCEDGLGSAYWPATTQGPEVECPANPFGIPQRALVRDLAGWIAVLDSVDLDQVAGVDGRIADLEQTIGPVSLTDSRMHEGLRDPYWVIFVGPFDSEDAASEFCASNPTLDPCYPRAP